MNMESVRNSQNLSDDSVSTHRRHHHHHHHHHPSSSSSSSPLDHRDGAALRKRQFSISSSNGTSPTPDCYGDDVGLGPRIFKLYVAGVPKTAAQEDIRSLFGEYGNVIEVVHLKSKWPAQQQECCFVKYATLEEADRAIAELNDRYTFPGGLAPLKVKYADGEKERHDISPYGVVEDVFIVRGEMRQHRGCAFVQFLRREMAVTAINALHGSYIMRGCEQPLIVRFADPKKPRYGGSRTAPYYGDQIAAMANDSHPSPNNRCKPHLVCASNASECGPNSCSSHYAVCPSAEPSDSNDCDWSEHICPDGYAYYYNCVTCDSRWEKPEEYALYERQLLKLEQQSQHVSHFEVLPTTEVSQM